LKLRAPKRIIVLCVDRDADIEVVTRRSTPIVGRDQVLAAAIDFAIKRPEDSDANSLFAAVQMYDALKETFGMENVEVAVLAGTPNEGLEADMKILSELENVLKIFEAEGAVLVSDGPTDEQILPIVQSKIPVISVKRVIVQQSRNVEETFVMLTRYIKKLFEEDKYRKYSLGVPGFLVILYVLFSFLNMEVFRILQALLAVLGLILIIKGFSLDEKVKSAYLHHPVTFVSILASLILAWVVTASIVTKLSEIQRPGDIKSLSQVLLMEIGGPIIILDILIFMAILAIVGLIGDQILESGFGNVPWRYYLLLVFVVLSRPILFEGIKIIIGTGDVIYLFYWTLITIIFSSLIGGFFLLRERIKGSKE